MKGRNRGALTLPGAIIIAGALMAIAIIWTSRGAKNESVDKNAGMPNINLAEAGMAPITAGDHILGNPNAPIKLVEYSDPSCPFCKLFHPTIDQIMETYGPTGNVAWVYRQFPIAYPDADGNILHPNSEVQAEALECAASLGGNTVFFNFLREWFSAFPEEGANRPANIDRTEISLVAKKIGLEKVAFDKCLDSHQFKSKVRTSYDEALESGITGTPHTILVTPSGNKIPLSGLQSYSTLKNTIDTLISTLPAKDNSQTTAASSTNIQITQ